MRHALAVPDLGLPAGSVKLGQWLVERGAEVTEGDRLVELVAESVTVDLSSPASGVLVELLADEDDTVSLDQVLAYIESSTAE
jgi:2-oxoglutarate dehydrogenase E2 component (dihydrolipoamide succinyltransferase)